MTITNKCYPFQKQLSDSRGKTSTYHQFVNIPLINFISTLPQRVLDIGCAGGKLGAVLKTKYPNVYVAGIEPNADAAKQASHYLDNVIHGTFESINLKEQNIVPHSFDTVILSDVIEHIYNPWEMMIQLKKWMTKDAQILLSVPNIQNLRILEDVYLYGSWKYQTQGLLDVTHIRFFTRKSIEQLLNDTGYQVFRIESVIDQEFEQLFNHSRNHTSINIELEKITIKEVSPEDVENFCAYQFLIHAVLTHE